MKILAIDYFTQLNSSGYAVAVAALNQKKRGQTPAFFACVIVTGYLAGVATAFFASPLVGDGVAAAGTAAVCSVARA